MPLVGSDVNWMAQIRMAAPLSIVIGHQSARSAKPENGSSSGGFLVMIKSFRDIQND